MNEANCLFREQALSKHFEILNIILVTKSFVLQDTAISWPISCGVHAQLSFLTSSMAAGTSRKIIASAEDVSDTKHAATERETAEGTSRNRDPFLKEIHFGVQGMFL